MSFDLGGRQEGDMQAARHHAHGGRRWPTTRQSSHRSAMGWTIFALALVLTLVLLGRAAAAQELVTYRKVAGFEDVKFDVSNAITNRGLVIDFTGNVGAMLDRTGKDVGSTKPIYKRAEYVSFCSAKLSREMMEADAANAGFCPYIVFLYETVAKPGEVVVGYRRLPASATAASTKALQAINVLLDGIAKEAVK